MLYKKHPSQLKLILVDPKKVEFSIYSDLEKHFLAKLPENEDAIITDVNKVVQTLNSVCKEMDDRNDLFKKAHARNIKEYNEKFVKHKVMGFGDCEIINGTNVGNKPYVDMYGGYFGYSENINNYIHTKTVRVAEE